MSTGKIVALGILGLIVMGVFGYGCAALSYRETCVKSEASIEAQYKQNQNNYDNMWKKFQEVAAVPAMYANDLKKLWGDAMGKRYEGDAKGAPMFKWIKEHNPSLPVETYTQLQRTLEAGRNGFEADQRDLIARKQAYDVILKGNRSLFFNWYLQFPRMDLDKFDIVTSTKTDNVFKDKKDDSVLFSAPKPVE